MAHIARECSTCVEVRRARKLGRTDSAPLARIAHHPRGGAHTCTFSAAALVLKSFAKTTSLPLGFEPRELLTARVDLPSPTYEDEKELIGFSNALLEKLRALPGVQHAALAANPPLMTGWQTGFLPEGAPEPPPAQLPSAEMTVVLGDYFGALGTSLLRGRAFQPQDTIDAPPVIIVDQLMVERYFPGQNQSENAFACGPTASAARCAQSSASSPI